MQHKVKKMGMVSIGDSGLPREQDVEDTGFNQYINLARTAAIKMDPAGLLLLGLSFSLILLTLNLAPSALGRWSNPSISLCSSLVS